MGKETFPVYPWQFIIIVGLLTGCAHFQSRPLSPAETTANLQARSLDNPDLKQFLEKYLRKEPITWPLPSWDLNALTVAAFYYHPDLDVARAKWSGARAALITGGERPNPSVSLSPAYDTTTPPPWILGLSFDIPVETAGKRGYRIAQARHLSEAARLNLAATAWQVRSRVRRSLLELYAARESESAQRQQADAQTKIVGLLEKQVEAGAASPIELTQARINLNTTRLALQDAQRQNAEARVQLADALGLPARALNDVELSFAGLNEFPKDLMTSEVRRQAALNRTDILGALAEYAASQAALQLEIAKQYPDLHLGPGYQLDQTDNKWSLGVTLTLPVLNQNQGAIAESKARREEAAARFVSVQAKALGEIDRAVAGYQAAREQAATAEALLADLKRRRNATQAMLDAGEVDNLTIAAAQAELSAGSLARLNSLVKAQQALAALEDAVQSPLSAAGAQAWENNPRLSNDPTLKPK
ncbi:MAG: TolC family protein [Verrucomicrobia bacterium]|nr:TolC family protein [Verrucomicrobiota bacterium]